MSPSAFAFLASVGVAGGSTLLIVLLRLLRVPPRWAVAITFTTAGGLVAWYLVLHVPLGVKAYLELVQALGISIYFASMGVGLGDAVMNQEQGVHPDDGPGRIDGGRHCAGKRR